MLLYKVSVKTFVKHRHISCSKERKPRDNIVLTFVWDVTKTRNVGSKNKHGEREIEKIGTKQRIGNEVAVTIFHFPVSHSLSPLPVPRDIRFGWVGRYCEDKTSLFAYDLWPMIRLGIVHNDRVCSDVRHHRAPISLRVRFRLTSTTFLPHFLIFQHNSTKETVANNAGDDKYAIDCCYNNVSWNRHD